MAELINLRRARKEKSRADKYRMADSNRAKHGTAKAGRDLAKARVDKAAHDLDVQRLDRDKNEA